MTFSSRWGGSLTFSESPMSFQSVLCRPVPGSAISQVNSMIIPLPFGAHSGPNISYCSFLFIQLFIAFHSQSGCIQVAEDLFTCNPSHAFHFLGCSTSRGSLSNVIRAGTSRGRSDFHAECSLKEVFARGCCTSHVSQQGSRPSSGRDTHPFRSTVCRLLTHTDSCSVPPSCCTSWDVGRAFRTILSHTRSGRRNTCRGLLSNHRAGREKETVNIWLMAVSKEEICKPQGQVSHLANTLSLYA